MSELSRYLLIAGACPYLVLGVAHALATPLRPDQRKGLSPFDPELGDQMAKSTLQLTRRTDMWRAWVGFNLSHSLGVVAFGVFVVLGARTPASFAAQGDVLVPLAVLVSLGYLTLAARYWFRTPILGCLFATAAFAASFLLVQAGR